VCISCFASMTAMTGTDGAALLLPHRIIMESWHAS
jgi:hypothetical protein